MASIKLLLPIQMGDGILIGTVMFINVVKKCLVLIKWDLFIRFGLGDKVLKKTIYLLEMRQKKMEKKMKKKSDSIIIIL